MVDSIPLHEILSIEEMNDDPEFSKTTLQSQSMMSFAANPLDRKNSDQGKNKNPSDCESNKVALIGHRQCIIQLKTVPEGFNLGRIYYLKANLDTPDRLIVTHLSEARIKAKSNQERKTKFQASQDVMRTVQESIAFQILVAVLILLVRTAFI
jgi:hypothetical protein